MITLMRIFILFGLFLLICAQAKAQDLPVPPPSSIVIEGEQYAEDPVAQSMQRALDKLEKLPPAIREELLEEAAGNRRHCENNVTLSNFYDCECFSLRILDERIDKGPSASYAAMIMSNNFKECASAPLSAGYGYKFCHEAMSLSRAGDRDKEKICQCTGRDLAKNFISHPAPEMEYIQHLFSDTLKKCREKLGQ